MNLTIAELNSEVIGKRLGLSCYNSAGQLLLKKGVTIEPNYYAHLKNLGYRSIYLLDGNPRGEAVSEILSQKQLAGATSALKILFQKLRRQSGDITIIKNELTALAKTFIQLVGSKTQKLPRVVTLKRQDEYLYQHAVSVAAYAILIGKKLRYDENKLLKLTLAALLYDIGMVFVDPEILNKTEVLEEKDFETVKSHTTVGFHHLVSQCAFEGLVGVPAVQHHERLDGNGYPQNLGGDDIHEYSRIIGLADFFDAWTSDRPHRRLHSVAETFEIIKQDHGKAFDPILAEILIDLFETQESVF